MCKKRDDAAATIGREDDAQTSVRSCRTRSDPLAQAAPRPEVDPAIAAIVAKVSAARLKDVDARLVAFGTRNTFSEKLGAKRGVFAARA